MPTAIKNVKAYSENDGLDKAAALSGEWNESTDRVVLYKPYDLTNGGPAKDEPFTLGFDKGSTPVKLKGVKYKGTVSGSDNLIFEK